MVPPLQNAKETSGAACVSVPIPASFRCPITHEVMADPVQTNDGHVYDRKSIAQWFERGHETSPMTGLRLPCLTLTTLEPLRRAIEDYVLTCCPKFAHHEIEKISLQKALEKLEAELDNQREASKLNIKQKRAWRELLVTAIHKDDAYVIRGLCKAEAQGAIELFTRQGFSLAVAALTGGSISALEALVEVGVSRDQQDVDGSTLTHYAVRQDDTKMLEALHRLGAPLDTMSESGTPLCTGAYVGNIQAVQMLQEWGVRADQNWDTFGSSVLRHASRREGNDAVIKELWASGVHDLSAIDCAAFYGNIENLETLLVLGASSNSQWPQSSIFWPFQAVWSSNASSVLQLLHRFSVPLDAVDNKFEFFEGRRDLEYWQQLHRHTSKSIKVNHFLPIIGDLALESCDQYRVETYEYLHKAWKSIGTWGCEGQTAAHWAAICGNCNAIRTLHNFNVSLASQDTAGCTPAHFAALMGHVEVLELLNSLGVTLGILSYSGRDPADYAEHMGQIAAASYLQMLEE